MRNRPLDQRPRSTYPASTPTRRAQPARVRAAPGSGAIRLHMFQTGTLRTQAKYIKMNQGEEDFEIPVPWFLIEHPRGNVVIDGGNAVEVAQDSRKHWGSVVDVYEPVMGRAENCVDQCRSVGVAAEDVRYVLQSHLHLDHSGAIGRFPRAQYYVQKQEFDYAQSPDWFSAGAYISADINRGSVHWRFLNGHRSGIVDLFHDGSVKMIFTPGHSPGHQSFLITLQNTGPVLLTIDAAYTLEHWNNQALPGLLHSAHDAAQSVARLREIADQTGAMVVTGHDPVDWARHRKAPAGFYD